MPGGGIGRHGDLKSLEGNFVPVQSGSKFIKKYLYSFLNVMKKITVVGSGYVGMSLSALLSSKHEVQVLDIDQK